MVRTIDSYPENRAKREGENLLKNTCRKCPFLSWGHYGLLVSDVFTEQRALPTSIKEKAHIIARNVRNYGEQKFGPMWAQGYAALSDGRIVFLQQSQQSRGEVQISEALEINIPYTPNYRYSIHIRYDLENDVVSTYEMRQEDSEPIIAYWIYDRPYLKTRVPADLKLHNIIGPIEEILQSVKIASNKITLTKPEPTPVVPA